MMTKEEILNYWKEPITVLDNGHVVLEDYMGSDAAITKAARASYQGGTTSFRDDRNLLRFLMRHKHYSPFAMCQVKFHFRVPLFINIQQLRHDRFHWNLTSARYSEMEAAAWIPAASNIRNQSQTNKQCSEGQLDLDKAFAASNIMFEQIESAYATYKEILELGVPREQARTVLPTGQYTEGYATANLGDWLLFLSQRLAPDAQYEIRMYAEAIRDILNHLFPETMEAFRDYQLNAITFTGPELKVLEWLLTHSQFNEYQLTEDPDCDDCSMVDLKNLGSEGIKALLSLSIDNKRERVELWNKLKKLGNV